MISKA